MKKLIVIAAIVMSGCSPYVEDGCVIVEVEKQGRKHVYVEYTCRGVAAEDSEISFIAAAGDFTVGDTVYISKTR